MSPGPAKQFDTDLALQKAMQLFWEHGFQGTSLSQLQCEMGIGKKSLYDTFGNKRQLFIKALDFYAVKSLDEVRERLQAPGPILEGLRRLFAHFQGSDCKGCFYGTNMANFDAEDEEIAQRFCRHLKDFENVLAGQLSKAKEMGELNDKVDPIKAAKMLNCLSQGTALTARVTSCSQWREDALDAAFTLLKQ